MAVRRVATVESEFVSAAGGPGFALPEAHGRDVFDFLWASMYKFSDPELSQQGWHSRGSETHVIDDGTLKAWFFREIFPLEASLTRYIRRNWRDEDEVADLRQEIYAKIYSSARGTLPLNAKAFLFTVARNHLINQSRKGHIVSLDLVADLGASTVMVEDVTPERVTTGREELRRVQAGLEQLPPRCREIVVLRRIEGLSAAEVAARMGLARNTVDQQVVHGMRALVDFMLGGTGKVRRSTAKRSPAVESEQ